MMKSAVIILIIGFIVFELIEHVIFPLFWSVKNRKKISVCGVTGMLGKVVEVKEWNDAEGKVFVDGELWRGVSEVSLLRGDKAIIQTVEGLTLRLKPFKDSSCRGREISGLGLSK
jgi:membrane-bound ClpP family serine protease